MPIASYDSIGKTITLRSSLNLISGREKISLLNDLLRDLGMMERFTKMSPGPFAEFNQIWVEQTQIHWNR
jgi:hypothetical protein